MHTCAMLKNPMKDTDKHNTVLVFFSLKKILTFTNDKSLIFHVSQEIQSCYVLTQSMSDKWPFC